MIKKHTIDKIFFRSKQYHTVIAEMFSAGPKYQKLTTNLRLAVNRLKLLEKKKTEMAVKARKEISEYIAAGKEDRARIRVEHIIREDYLVEALEIIEMYCDLLLARIGLIQSTKELDEGLEEPIASVIWATPRLQSECQELKVITEQFTAKYGKEFAMGCRNNALDNVNEKLMHKLAVQAPPKLLVEKYLEEIAKTYNVPFEPDPSVVEGEVLAAEGMLIDFGGNKGGNNGGGGGQMQPLQPTVVSEYPDQTKPQAFNPNAALSDIPPAMPPAQPFAYPNVPPPQYQPPPLPSVPPSGPPPAAAGASGGLPTRYDEHIYDNPRPTGPSNPNMKFPGAPQNAVPRGSEGPPPILKGPEGLPELPSVPVNSLPPGGASAGGEDVDFDELTKRFQDLKKKK